jgi:hypothetical protein
MAAALGCGVLVGLIVFEAIHFWWDRGTKKPRAREWRGLSFERRHFG